MSCAINCQSKSDSQPDNNRNSETIYGKIGELNELHIATLQNDFELVKSLVEDGFDVNAKDGMGWTPLRFSASHGSLEIMKFLVGHGARVETDSDRQWTCLHSVAGMDHVECLAFLLSRGASADVVSKDGLTPLHVAVCYGNKPEAITLLVQNGKASTEILDNNGFSPLHLACMNGRLLAVERLLSLGCDPFFIMTKKENFRPAIWELLSKYQEQEEHTNSILRNMLVIGRFFQLLVSSGDLGIDTCFYTLDLLGSGNTLLSKSDLRLFTKTFLDRSTFGITANRRFTKSALLQAISVGKTAR